MAFQGDCVFSDACSIKPFVFWIEGGDGDVDDAEVAYCTMAATGFDHDGGEGFERMFFAVEFDVTFPFQDQVDLSHLLVIVDFAVFFDVYQVDGRGSVFGDRKGSAGLAAGAGGWIYLIELGDEVVFGRWSCHVGYLLCGLDGLGDFGQIFGGVDLGVFVNDFAVFADDEGPAGRGVVTY